MKDLSSLESVSKLCVIDCPLDDLKELKQAGDIFLCSSDEKQKMDIISLNQSNSLKNDIQKDISDVNDKIDNVLGDIDIAISDSLIDQAESLVIRESLEIIQKEKLDIDARYLVLYGNTYLDGNIKDDFVKSKNDFDLSTSNLEYTFFLFQKLA